LRNRRLDARLLIHDQTDVSVRADENVQEIVRSWLGDLESLDDDVGREWLIIARCEYLSNPNLSDAAKEDVTLFAASRWASA
jgi:hypothetical protein